MNTWSSWRFTTSPLLPEHEMYWDPKRGLVVGHLNGHIPLGTYLKGSEQWFLWSPMKHRAYDNGFSWKEVEEEAVPAEFQAWVLLL